jgi:2-polyprenyl-3-methyl-5-hydroxy-6-metoxy-1,4-benzoquinol methylase
LNCHICEKETSVFVDEKTSITYYHCEDCEYIFKSAECYQDFDAQKERYNLHTNDEKDEGYKAYFQRFLDFTLPLVGNPKSALDFGCGESTILSSMLNKKGMKCDYYDPIYHPNTLDDSKKYELIVSTEVFEHLHHPSMVFSTLLDRLKSGGYLAIQTEFHSNDSMSFKKWWYPQDTTHIVFFRAQTFRVLCEANECNYVADNGKNMVVIQKV